MPFIRVKWIKSGNSKRPYSYLVESVWEKGKVKQKVIKYLGSGDLRMQTLKQKLGTRFKQDLEKQYEKLHKKRQGKSMVTIPELWQKMKQKGYSRKEFERELLELQDKRIIDLQVHYSPTAKEREEGIETSSMEAPFYFVNWRDRKSKLGTTTKESGPTETKIKYHFDEINEETRAGNMVQIPKLWREMKKEGISRKEFEKTLYKLEKERKIDLQVASATYVLKPEDRKLGMPHPTRGHINYVVWRTKPSKTKDIFISTKKETIKEEIRENKDPNWDDFWPVSSYPKDITLGKSRLHLTEGKKKVASFVIEGKGVREWKGKKKKVLLLKKGSVKKEKGLLKKDPAAMGGYRYI